MASFLKTLFLGTALALTASKNLHAQNTTLAQSTSSSVQFNEHKSRTGILYIRGPESIEDKPAQDRVANELIHFNMAFKNDHVRIVGNGRDSVTIDDILNNIDSLAEQDINRLVIVKSMHGEASMEINRNDKDLRTVNTFKYDNRLLYKQTGEDLSADTLFMKVGKRFSDNPKLHDVELKVIDGSCFSETALNAYHYLKPGTDIFFYSSFNAVTTRMNYANSFALAANELKVHTASGNNIYALAALSANSMFGAITNDFFYVSIQDAAPDTLKWRNKDFYLGDHKGKIVKPFEMIDQVLNDHDSAHIADDMKEYADILTTERIFGAIDLYRTYKEARILGHLSGMVWDVLGATALTIARKHPEYGMTTIQHARENLIGCIDKIEIPLKPVIHRPQTPIPMRPPVETTHYAWFNYDF